MADIDKSLPNVRHEIKIPGAKEMTDVDITEQQPQQPVEVTPDEEGGATVNFEPSAVNRAQSNTHFDNLADILPETVLDPVGIQLRQNYTDYKMSRKDWEQSYVKGLDLLGFKYDNRAEPFQGASGATHPVLAEAVTQFQAQAYKELLPADGPVRTQSLGKPSRQKEEQAVRVKNFMNYQLMDVMKEYEPEFEQNLRLYPLQGDILLEPGGTAMTQGFYRWDHPVRIDSYQPHGHVHLHGMSIQAVYPSGRTELLSMVTDFDARWHHSYIFEDDVAPLLPEGTVIVMTGWYDNTADNPLTDSEMFYTRGSRTVDEMSHAWIAVTHLTEEGYEKLVEERESKVVSQ